MTTTTAHITVDRVSKRYGTLIALDAVSLNILPGQMVAVVGPSGCGKSTLLRLLSGFIKPDEGQILLDAEPIHHLPPEQRPTALVFQNYALWPHKTVYENIAFGLRVGGWNSTAIAHRVKEMLELVELAGLERRYPNQLSGGQQQRVALARSLAIAPSILLLDEPLSNLDAQIRLQMRTELRALQQRVGLTTLYVTHDQEEALSVADQVVVMHQGRVEQYAPPIQVYRRPASPFVAHFVGQSNLLRGCIWALEPHRILVELLPTHSKPSHPPLLLTAQRKNWTAADPPQLDQVVTLAIKPEQVRFDLIDSVTQPHTLKGKVSSLSFLGARWQLCVSTEWGTIAITTDMPALETGAIAPGRIIQMHLPAEHLILFMDAPMRFSPPA
jgi:putative spermidine/putrescine transport system ATP-binding protein